MKLSKLMKVLDGNTAVCVINETLPGMLKTEYKGIVVDIPSFLKDMKINIVFIENNVLFIEGEI